MNNGDMDPLWHQAMSGIDDVINEVIIETSPSAEEEFQEPPRFPVGSPHSILKTMDMEVDPDPERAAAGRGPGGASKKAPPESRRSAGSADLGTARKKLAFDDECLGDLEKKDKDSSKNDPDFQNYSDQVWNDYGIRPDEVPASDTSSSSSTSESEPDCEITPEFLHIPRRNATWVDGRLGSVFLARFFQMCASRLESNGWKPYGLKDLPLPISYRKMAPGVSGLGYVTRVGNPGNFYMIFEGTSVIDRMLDNEKWSHFFKRSSVKVNYRFRSSLQLYHGMSALLVEFQNYLGRNPGLRPPARQEDGGIEYRVGDLVAIKVLRFVGGGGNDDQHDKNGEGPETAGILNGYRGVIKEIALARNAVTMRYTEKHFVIHLVDTGEDIVVTENSVTPLPWAFTGFPPMAVKCSLHGISSIGSEWSTSANEKMKHYVRSHTWMELSAEFHPSLYSFEEACDVFGEPRPTTSTLTLLRDFTSPPPFAVELTRSVSTISVNISEVLIDQHYGMEPLSWNIPSSPGHFRKRGPSPPLQEEEGAQKKFRSVPDLNAFMFGGSKDEGTGTQNQFGDSSSAQPVGNLYSQQVDLESVSFFANEPEVDDHAQFVTPGESNDVSIGVPEVGLTMDLS